MSVDSRVKPTFNEFCILASQGNCIPVYVDEMQDLITPVGAHLKLSQDATHSFLFESVSGGERLGRYSFVGSNPDSVVRTGPHEEVTGDPLVYLEKKLSNVKYVALPNMPTFMGGAVCYISYDCIHYFEPSTRRPTKDILKIPEACFMWFNQIVIFDHLYHHVKAVSHCSLVGVDISDETALRHIYDIAVGKAEDLMELINAPDMPSLHQEAVGIEHKSESNIGQSGYEKIVKNLKADIVKGDIIQAVPSQRIHRPTDLHPFNVYRRLRSVNPAPYMYYLNLGDFDIIGASPETLVKVIDGVVETHPIAGTRRRGKTPQEDDALAEELLADEKERAEHIMLVDLGRNDINRVCRPDTVQINSLMHIERYSHVMHIVSRVTGSLRDGLTAMDAFRSVFPAGTVSGAPKIRAIQLVAEYEKERRGVYAGAVGYFGYNGDIDTAIAIRTIVIKDGVAILQAGGGITFDSDPTLEFEETLNKLNANVVTLDKAEREMFEQQLSSRMVSVEKKKNTRTNHMATTPIVANRSHEQAYDDQIECSIDMISKPNIPDDINSPDRNLTIMIDNYDSFTWNVYQYLCDLGANVVVYRNDKVTADYIAALAPTHVVISPGPGCPENDAGVSSSVIERMLGKCPILGVCMGEQVMCHMFGGTVSYAGEIMHGKTSSITHDGKGLYAGLPRSFNVIRYHSLSLNPSTLPECLEITSRTDNDVVMGIRHKKYVMEGVQYHPESILSECGKQMLGNFLSWKHGVWADTIEV